MKAILLFLVATLSWAQDPVYPGAIGKLHMLLGQWAVHGGKPGFVEFRLDRKRQEIVGNARAADAPWRTMMVISADGDSARADFFPVGGETIHYRLDYADGTRARFVTNAKPGAPVRSITYRRQGSEQISYSFETNGRVVESGTLEPVTLVRPLTD
jgi:hypothetical protein